jgi:hypothetical protein
MSYDFISTTPMQRFATFSHFFPVGCKSVIGMEPSIRPAFFPIDAINVARCCAAK